MHATHSLSQHGTMVRVRELSILCKLKTSQGIIKTRSGYITKDNKKPDVQKYGKILFLDNANPTRKSVCFLKGLSIIFNMNPFGDVFKNSEAI